MAALNWMTILFGLGLLSSQSAMDAFAVLLSLVWMFLWSRDQVQKNYHYRFSKIGFDWIFVVWFMVAVVGYAVNWHHDLAWAKGLLDFKWILFFYILIAVLKEIYFSEKVIPWVLGIVGVICIYSIAVFFAGFDFIRPNNPMSPMAGGVRAGGLYANYMVFGHVFAQVFCVLAGVTVMLFWWKDKLRWLSAAVCFLLAAALLLSFTRGAWIAVAGAVLVMSLILSFRLFLGLLTTIAVTFGVLFSSWPDFQSRVLYSFNGQGGDSERIYMWKANLQMFLDNPVLGVGYGENTTRLVEYYQKTGAPEGLMQGHAHNQYLNYLAGTGALGLLCWLVFSVLMIRLCYKLWLAIPYQKGFHKGLALGAIGAQVALHLGALTESNFEHSKMKYMLSLVWAIVVWLAYEYKVLRERV